jgi:membrane protease YdiL (CAAX protease family)
MDTNFPLPENRSDLPEVVPVEAIQFSPPMNALPRTSAISPKEMTTVLPAEESELPAVLPAPSPPHPGFWWAILWCMGFLFVTQIVSAIVVLVVMALFDLAGTPAELIRDKLRDRGWMVALSRRSMAPTLLVTELMVITISLVVIRFVVGSDWKRQLAVRRPSWWQVLLVLLSFPAVLYLGSGVYLLARRWLPGLEKLGIDVDVMKEMVELFRSWPWWFAVPVIGLGPGIGEELWCRGFLGRGFVGRYGVIPGILLTSFFFGAIHVDPHQGTMAMIMGLFLHYVYLTTRSLWMPMLLHFLVNSTSVVADKLHMEDVDTAPEQIPWVVYVGSALLLASVAWALYRSRTRLAVLTETGMSPWRPEFPGVEYPPAGSFPIIKRPWPGWLASGLVLAGIAAFTGCICLAEWQKDQGIESEPTIASVTLTLDS